MNREQTAKIVFATIFGGMGLFCCFSAAFAAETTIQSATESSTTVTVSPPAEKAAKKSVEKAEKKVKKAKAAKVSKVQAKQKSFGAEGIEKAADKSADKAINNSVNAGEMPAGSHSSAPAASDNTKDQPAETKAAHKPSGKHFSGNVSWYGPGFNGKKTASGERFDMNKKTAAHRTLPFFTKVLVEDPKTGKTVVVKVNDRGPFVHSRVMDLSREGARQLGTLLHGISYVDCLVVTGDPEE